MHIYIYIHTYSYIWNILVSTDVKNTHKGIRREKQKMCIWLPRRWQLGMPSWNIDRGGDRNAGGRVECCWEGGVYVTALFMRTSLYTQHPPLHSESSSPDVILVSSISYTFQVPEQNLLRRVFGVCPWLQTRRNTLQNILLLLVMVLYARPANTTT